MGGLLHKAMLMADTLYHSTNVSCLSHICGCRMHVQCRHRFAHSLQSSLTSCVKEFIISMGTASSLSQLTDALSCSQQDANVVKVVTVRKIFTNTFVFTRRRHMIQSCMCWVCRAGLRCVCHKECQTRRPPPSWSQWTFCCGWSTTLL